MDFLFLIIGTDGSIKILQWLQENGAPVEEKVPEQREHQQGDLENDFPGPKSRLLLRGGDAVAVLF